MGWQIRISCAVPLLTAAGRSAVTQRQIPTRAVTSKRNVLFAIYPQFLSILPDSIGSGFGIVMRGPVLRARCKSVLRRNHAATAVKS